MKAILFLIVSLTPFMGFSQAKQFSFPEIPETGKSITTFIPLYWEIMDTISADLNKDNLRDCAIVIKAKQSLNAGPDNFVPKMLLILFRKQDKTWQLSTVATRLFDTTESSPAVGHHYKGLTIKNQVLGVRFAYGGTVIDYMTYFFSLQNNNWYLTGFDDEQIDTQRSLGVYEVSYETTNYVTGVKEHYTYAPDSSYQVIKIARKPLTRLAAFNNNGLGNISEKADRIDGKNTKIIEEDDDDFLAKATVSKKDSIIHINGHLRPGYRDYRIFGYAKPDTSSQKIILISIFTSDVKGNPFNCPFGAYYGTNDLKGDSAMQLKYLAPKEHFIKAGIMKNDKQLATVYMEKRWVKLEAAYINPTGTYKWKHVKNAKFMQGYPGHVQVKALDKYHIALNLHVQKGPPSYHSGSAFDTLYYYHNQAVYQTKPDSSCKITFRFTNKGVYVNEKTDNYNHGCGFGHAVIAAGFFEKISAKEPVFINYGTGRKLE